MKAVPAGWAAAVSTSHVRTRRVEVWAVGGTAPLVPDLPVVGGEVTFDLGDALGCHATVECADPQFLPKKDSDPVTPYGNFLRIYAGVADLGEVLLGEFPIVTVPTWSPLSSWQIGCESWLRWLRDDIFLVPWSPAAGASVMGTISSLVAESLPWRPVPVFDPALVDAPVPAGSVWDTDRFDAVTDLAGLLRAVVTMRPDGRVGVGPEPVPLATDPPQVVIGSGDEGTLLSGSRPDFDRAERFNGVRALNPDTPEVFGWAYLLSPSVAFWGGGFGRKPLIVEDRSLTTVAAAEDFARKRLEGFSGRSRVVDVSMVPNPAIEVGDRVDVVWPDGVEERCRVRVATVPLGLAEGKLGLRGAVVVP